MLIDWFTVGAQALNFLILVWLMKRFLYQPILNAIDEREKKVAAELADADAKKAEAHKERDEFLKKNEKFDSHHAALLTKATNEAKGERKRLLDEARKESDDLRAQRHGALAAEFDSLSKEIARQTQDEVFDISRKTLADLASVGLEARMVDVFVERLRDLSAKDQAALLAAFKASTVDLEVSSAFELPPAQRTAIEGALKKILPAKSAIHYETVPKLVSGIEISVNGWRIAWNVADYLGSLEKGIGELVKAPAKVEAKGK